MSDHGNIDAKLTQDYGRSSYIYVPLGGSKNVVLATLLVFTFVALWHDLSFRLLTWGWLVSLFILPELVAGKMVPKNKVRSSASTR